MNAVIFGASSGIGRELAIKLVSNGYRVVVSGRRTEMLQQLCQEYSKMSFLSFDVQDLGQVEHHFNTVIAELKTIDLIIHCAGIGYENPELEWQLEFDTLTTNVISAAKIYGLSFRHFKRQGFGHLVGISSIASLRGNRHAPAYFASKAFQVNYLESLYFKTKEVKSGRVFVTDIRPGYIDTRMALGDDIFWMASLRKASTQIYSAIKRRKRKVYISKRWLLIACVLKFVPSWIIKKIM